MLAGLLTGCTAGLCCLIHNATGWSFGGVFFLINLPFYWLVWRPMGWHFKLKRFFSFAQVSVLLSLHPNLA